MNSHTDDPRSPHDGRTDGISGTSKSGVVKMTDQAIWPIRIGMEEATRQAGEATERFNRTFGFSGAEADRLALQSRRNMDAVRRCGTVLTQSIQKSSRSWMGMVQGQWTRNFDGMSRLMQAKSVHEFGTIQGDLARENLEHVLKGGRIIAESSMQAADEAGKSFANVGTLDADKA